VVILFSHSDAFTTQRFSILAYSVMARTAQRRRGRHVSEVATLAATG